jgi:hypothetical protein
MTPLSSMCVDTEGFVDVAGYPCSFHGENELDCTDEAFYLGTGFDTHEAWKSLVRNCPVSCGLCGGENARRLREDPSLSEVCSDTEGFVDIDAGYPCNAYAAYDCLDEDLFVEGAGYSREAWQDIVENCPFSCGLCEGQMHSS